MVKLTFYGGVNEIGGNKILLEDKDARVFLDFGMSFGTANRYFSEFLQPRKCNGLGDFFEFGLIPNLKGIYRQDFLKHMGIEKEELDFDGVLVSHAHADHASYINHLREDLPIYSSPETFSILKAMNDTGAGSFNDLTELVRCFETYINKKGELSRKTSQTHEDLLIERDFRTFKFGESFKIKHLTIEPYQVDHSLPGATGYIIHTSSGTVVYTGDFRFHGRREKKTQEFMDACRSAEPDVLIIEGTRIDSDSDKKEIDVEQEICSYTSKAKGLSVCNWSIRDTDRMLSFLNAAKHMGKKLAISLKQAYLLDQLSKCSDTLAPKLEDENIEIYAARKSWGMIGDSSCDKKIRNQDYDTWERPYLDRAICYQEVRENQDEFLMFCSNFDLKEMIDVKPCKGSVYIKSACEPFDAEMKIDWNRVKNWINHFGMKINRTHVSGHASGLHLKQFIDYVVPKVVIPIHTENADAFKNWSKKVIIPTKIGDSYAI
ncbi:MAG: MBL fold metallo-hydrolase [Candidatus Bathyarchaeota archaeon]|nr:MBL fold metallo-hydrolase [Candidatus Bathyarchaeota archaeon]